ncbi:uncharacterized protein LOC135114682 [Scylla paramamosain]|uniref:uncharacterized protein LOC135114682 n=1 Tax=Scylla paramamosain TaxID=85552 RepID=UPI003083A518
MEGNASLAYPSTPLGVVCVQPRQEGTRKKWLMRPFKLNRLVGTRFEEAAIRYAAEVRRAARFPPTSTSTSITTALTSHATTRSGQILASSLRHQYERPVDRRGSRVVPTQPVRPTVHVADPSTSTPHPSIRHWEGDTVVRGIQEIRSQFVRSETESFPRHHSQPQRPSSRPPLLPVSPPRDAATRTVRPTWPLFHRSGGRGRGRHQVQEEEDVWIDIEKVSPPRTTYHLYRLSADGTSSALPITVIPSFTTSLHSMNPTSHGAHGLLVDHRDFPPQNRAAVTPRRQLHPLVVTKAQQSHFSNSRFMEHQTTSFQASQQLDDSSLVRHPSSNRFHKKPLVFTVPQEQKTGTPAEATENVVSLEDDDIELMSNGEVDLIEISSDSSPEVNCGALKIKSTCDGESHSSQVLAAASQANLCKGSRRSSFSVNANSSKLLTSKDEELPDLTCAQSSTKLPSEDDSKVEDNLSDVSTIFFEEMHFDEWMNDVMENMTTSTSSSGSTEVVPSTSLVDASASHNQTERNITMVNDNNEMVALLCAEQCTNLTTGEKGCDAVKQIVINHPPETEDKSKEWPAGHSDTTPHQDVQSDQDTRSTSDKRIIGDNKVREAAPVHHAHDENTKLTKEDDKKQITNAVREAEPVHYAHSENIKVTDEDNIRYITNDPLQAKLEDGITSEKYDVAAMENGAVEEVPLEVTQSKISKEETASQEANELPVTAIGLSGTNNMSISNTFNHACMTRKMNMDSAPQNYPITAVVGEVRSSPSWSTKEEGADTARNLLENDKALEEPTTLACGSEKKRKQIVKTKVKKRKRRSTKLKEVQRLETTWRRHDGDDEDCLQVIDPSCTLFVSDGQLVVAMEVPTCTPNENANAIEKSGETEMPPQHSIRSPLPSDFLHLHISSPLQSPTAIAVNPKGMSNACEMNEHQSTKSETGDAITSLLHVSNLEGKEQANKEQGEADEGHAKSVKETQTYEEHGEEINSKKIEEAIYKENELTQISKSLIQPKKYKQSEISETEGTKNSETEQRDATCFPLICTNKMLAKTAEDTERVNAVLFIRDEASSEANKDCENTTAAKLRTDTELNQILNEVHKKNYDAEKATEKKMNILIQDSSCNSKSENVRLAALIQETVEKKNIPKPVPQTVEERTNLEKTLEEEKTVTPVIVHGVEEKAVTLERGSEVKNKIETFERVPEEDKRITSEYVSAVEDTRINHELAFERKKTQGTEKDSVDSVVFSHGKDDTSSEGHIRLAVGRNSNSSSTSIFHLAECLTSLRLKERPACPLTQPHTQPTVSSNIIPSVDQDDSHTLNSLPDSASLCRQRYMDALKDLMEEVRLMGERKINSKSGEKGADSLDILSFDTELFQTDNQRACIKRNGKEETERLTIIQCVAKIHSSADVESNDQDNEQFKLPQLTVECEALLDDSRRGDEKRHYEITAEIEKTNLVESTRKEDHYAYSTLREAKDVNIKIKEALKCPLKDVPVVKIITEAHGGRTPEPMVNGIEAGEREISVHLSSDRIKELCADLENECKGSASFIGVSKDVDLKHNDVPVVMRTKEEKHLVQGSRECNTASEEYLVAMPPQGINIKIMKNISVDSVPDSCPPLSVSNFAKKAAMKINQLCGESNVLRLQQDGRGLPVEFSHIVEDFMNTVHCEREVQEKQVGTALPVGNNMIQSLDSEQHSADGKVEGSYFSSRGTDPLPSMNCTQPVDCEIHSAICMTREAKSGAQPLEREQPPVSETHPSVSWIQLAVCKTQPAICNIQPEFRGIQPVECVVQPVVCEMQPAVSETHPSGSGTQPEACDIHLAVCETQPAVSGTQPAVSATRPAVSETQPVVNETQPALSGTQPAVSGTHPALNGTQPAAVGIQPAVSGTQPAVNGTQPAVSETQPAVSGTKPAVSGTQPTACETHPALSGTQPAVSGAQPAISGTQPAVSGTQPALSETQPTIHVSQASVCETQPAVCRTQPLVCGSQPPLCGTQPEACDIPLAVCETQPAICRTQPAVCGTQPGVHGTQPMVNVVQTTQLPASVVSLRQPMVSKTHPSIKDVQSSSSVDQTPTHQTRSSSSWSLQSSEVNPSPASEAQPPDLNHGSDVAKERKKRCRDESADEESEVEGSRGRKRRKKARVTTHHHIVEVSLTERYMECLRMVAMAGEAFLSPLRGHGVMRPSHGFASLQPEHTRSLLNQMVRSMRGRCQSASDEKNSYYKNLLALHGLIKAGDLLLHCGLEPALRCLDQFHHTHHVLLAGCYTDVVARLAAVQERGGEGVVHPKVTTLRREMEQARQREDPGDTEFKVLVVVKREVQWVHHQLEEEFGSDNVALLSRLPEYDRVLHLLEQQSVVVWEEGEALHQLPCSQFNLVVEWEGSSGSSICVDHCTRQNIHVVSFITPSPSVGDKEPVSRNEDRDQQEGKVSINISRNESSGEIRNNRGCGQRDSLMIVASTSVTAKNELHYILTSIFNINLIERNPRDVIIEEGRQGWADLLLDERTCVLLRPLATLRSDAHLNQLTCQLVLLSLQCTTCYIILYAEQSNSSGYEFRSSVMRALTRLVATCVLFHSPEYTVSLLLAYNLHQVGELIRDLCEATRSSSPVWDPEEWTTRPWLTSQMSSHERLLLSFPCINSISAQVILTAMSLLQVLESSFSHMRNILPWIPSKVIKMLQMNRYLLNCLFNSLN